MTDVAGEAAPPAAGRKLSLIRLDERLLALEQPQAKSPVERIKESAGLLALAISICTGGFTIADTVWIKPHQERAAARSDKVARLRSDIQQMSAINQSASQAISAAADPSEKMRINLTALGQKRTLLADARTLEPSAGDALSTSDYLVLAVETVNVADLSTATSFAHKAALRATNGFEREEALRNKGSIEFMNNAVAQGRADFLHALRAIPEMEFASQRANVLGTWAFAEAYHGNCTAVQPLLGRFMTAVNLPSVDATTRATYIGMLKQQLQTVRQCKEGQISVDGLA